jgi:hypothetical protein
MTTTMDVLFLFYVRAAEQAKARDGRFNNKHLMKSYLLPPLYHHHHQQQQQQTFSFIEFTHAEEESTAWMAWRTCVMSRAQV